MEFKSLQIKNFRSFENISIDLSNKNVFFGLNDVGKTNLLTALRFVFDRNVRRNDFVDSDYFEKKTETPIEILVTVNINDDTEDSDKLRAKLKGSILTDQNEVYIQLIAKYDDSEMSGIAEMFWGGDKKDLHVIKSRGTRFDIDDVFNVFYIDSYVDMDQLFKRNIKKLIKSDTESDTDIINSINSIVDSLNQKISNLSGVSKFEAEITPKYQKFTDENLSISIKSEIALKGLYSNIVPYMKKNDDDNMYPTAGDGRKKLIVYSLFTLLAEQERDKKINLFLVEEPENNLHKSLQIELSDILFGNSESYPYLFVSTHSPYILYEMNEVTLVRIFSRRQITSNSSFYEVPSEFKNNKKMLNRLLAEAIFSNNVLLVEGPSEQLFFDKILSVINPYYEVDGIYILSVNGTGFQHYLGILKKLGIHYVIKTDNDIQWREEEGYYALGFSRVNNLVGEILLNVRHQIDFFNDTKEEFKAKSINYRRQLYNDYSQILNSIGTDNHVFLSKVDLENDIDEVLHENLVHYLGDDPVAYLQKAKNNNMVMLIEKLTNEDCRKIYDDDNFACLKELFK
ncbi:ATP-dependent nuclease [Fructobacillus tropaeoli]|uniref:ATP-dependent nuclease n=1 Tax=Fructobacillus tropaeoli TaxID=709323 RepID=UPI002D9304A6|nr:Predicted ATP-dependent endonuclease of the OLD family [Fructobacillus tropaeoli]